MADQENVEVTIRLTGSLPKKYLTKKQISKIEEKIRNAAMEEFGEFEIWGEFFGSDDNIYALFLTDVVLKRDIAP